VADLGQRVVFREERDGCAFRADARAEGRLEATKLELHVVPVLLEERGDVRDSLALLVRELGRAVDGARQDDEVVT